MQENLYERESGAPPPFYRPSPLFPHYYGDIVRKLLLAAGLILLLTMPFFYQFMSVPLLVLLVSVLIVVTVAGITNPKQWWVMVLDILVATQGLVMFEYNAIRNIGEIPWALFIIDQTLAVTFFFALYFAIKTLRGEFVQDVQKQKNVPAEQHSSPHQYPGPDPRTL